MFMVRVRCYDRGRLVIFRGGAEWNAAIGLRMAAVASGESGLISSSRM